MILFHFINWRDLLCRELRKVECFFAVVSSKRLQQALAQLELVAFLPNTRQPRFGDRIQQSRMFQNIHCQTTLMLQLFWSCGSSSHGTSCYPISVSTWSTVVG